MSEEKKAEYTMEQRLDATGREHLFGNLRSLQKTLASLNVNNVNGVKPELQKILRRAMSWEKCDSLEK